MPFNGSGTFLRVMDWEADRDAGIKIRADRHDQEDDNFAAGLSNTLTKDGQSQPTANIPLNGFKLINVGAPVDPTDAATKGYADGIKKFTNNIEVTKTIFFKDGTTTRGYIDSAIGSGVAAAMIFETDNDAGVMVNRMAMNVTGLYLAKGNVVIEDGGLISRSGTGVLLTSQGGSPVIRGSMIPDITSPSGTVAIRSYNNAGLQDGMIYINSAEVGTDRNTISIAHAADQAIWFRKPDGNIRGAVYNFIGGSMDLRAYNTTSNTLVNLLRVGADRQLATLSYGFIINSDGTPGDVFQNHRVSTTRATRIYYAANGDVSWQQTDDNFASSFVNLMLFYRSSQQITFLKDVFSGAGGFVTQTFGKGMHVASAGAYGVFSGNNIDGVSVGAGARTNVDVATWWGFGVRAITDNATRWAVDSRTGDVIQMGVLTLGSAQVYTDGNIKFAGSMASGYGVYLSDALYNSARWNNQNADTATGFPIGTVLIMYTNGVSVARNSLTNPCLSSADNRYYRLQGQPSAGTRLDGIWRACGHIDSNWVMVQRIP